MERTIRIQTGAEAIALRAAGAEAVGNLAANVVIGALAMIGSPVTRAAAGVRASLAARAERRRQRRADEQLWNAALADARIMADLSRAMSREAVRGARYY